MSKMTGNEHWEYPGMLDTQELTQGSYRLDTIKGKAFEPRESQPGRGRLA